MYGIAMPADFLKKANELVSSATALKQESQGTKATTLAALRGGISKALAVVNELHDAQNGLFDMIAKRIDQDDNHQLLDSTSNILGRAITLEKAAKTPERSRIFQQVAMVANDLALSIIEKAGDKSREFFELCKKKIAEASSNMKNILSAQQATAKLPASFKVKTVANADYGEAGLACQTIKDLVNANTEITGKEKLQIYKSLRAIDKLNNSHTALRSWADDYEATLSSGLLLSADLHDCLSAILTAIADSKKYSQAKSLKILKKVQQTIYQTYLNFIRKLYTNNKEKALEELKQLAVYINRQLGLDAVLEFVRLLEDSDLDDAIIKSARTDHLDLVHDYMDELHTVSGYIDDSLTKHELEMLNRIAAGLRYINQSPDRLKNYPKKTLNQMVSTLTEILANCFDLIPDFDDPLDSKTNDNISNYHHKYRELVSDLITCRNFILSVADISKEHEMAPTIVSDLRATYTKQPNTPIQRFLAKADANHSQHRWSSY